jgi:hypothetical protein
MHEDAGLQPYTFQESKAMEVDVIETPSTPRGTSGDDEAWGSSPSEPRSTTPDEVVFCKTLCIDYKEAKLILFYSIKVTFTILFLKVNK